MIPLPLSTINSMLGERRAAAAAYRLAKASKSARPLRRFHTNQT